MRFTLGITTKYIDRHPTASMTKNPLTGISSEHPMSIKLRTTDNCIKSKVCNINKAYALEHMNVVFSLVAIAHLQPYRFLSLPQVK
jgi:hypothetical protein